MTERQLSDFIGRHFAPKLEAYLKKRKRWRYATFPAMIFFPLAKEMDEMRKSY